MQLEKIKITRIYGAENGLSYFEDLEIPMLVPVGNKQKISKTLGSGSCRVFQFGADFSMDWHVTSSPACFIYMQGAQEIEVSGGEIRQFGVGDILLAEDTTGKGHKSRSISPIAGRALIIDASCKA